MNGKEPAADISDEMMREQSRTARAYWLYICEHKALPPQGSLIARHLARAWACDTLDMQHIGLCDIGVDLIRCAVSGAAPPTLTDAIEAFEIWLRAKDVYRATFRMKWETDEFMRALRKNRPHPDPSTRALLSRRLLLEREIYERMMK